MQREAPGRFEEKYKEHDPIRHAETVAKVVASGKTPAGSHVPILVDECLEVRGERSGMAGLDCALGVGGYAGKILEMICPGGN